MTKDQEIELLFKGAIELQKTGQMGVAAAVSTSRRTLEAAVEHYDRTGTRAREHAQDVVL